MDLNNQPVPEDWLLKGVTPAVDNPKARWMTKEGHASLDFVLPKKQDVNLYLVVAYPFRLQGIEVYFNGNRVMGGQAHEAWYKQFLSVDVPARGGHNTLDVYASGPSGQPEGYLRLNQIQIRKATASGPGEEFFPFGVVMLLLVPLIALLRLRRLPPGENPPLQRHGGEG